MKGMYLEDEMEGVHESLIQRYYGVFGRRSRPRPPGQTDAGRISAEDSDLSDSDSDMEEVDSDAERDSRRREEKLKPGLPYHAAVKTPRVGSPFNEEQAQLFEIALQEYFNREDDLPEDVNEGWEWNEEATLRTGRGRPKVNTPLPESVWKPRAVMWSKALRILEACIQQISMDSE